MNRARPGILVTFEGTEGAGKSTLISLLQKTLARRLRACGRSRRITVTREPGGSPVAERIRGILLNQKMDPWCELLLYEASRAEHLARTIHPALARGDLVLCDRFTDSSLAYQGQARGLPWKKVKALNHLATQGLRPALTVLVDVDPATGLARARERNRFEAEGLAFQARVRQGFLRSLREEPRRWHWLQDRKGYTPARKAEEIADLLCRRFRLTVNGAVRRSAP